MTETREFPTEAVISTITGRLIGKIDGVYEVLTFMTGGDVWTHQLPRISREAAPVIFAMHPHLAGLAAEAEQVTPENWQEWRDRWLDRYGPTIAVPLLGADQHERIDPMSELAERFHPDRIVAVTGPDPKGA